MKRIAVLGSGVVGQVLADGFLTHGDEVMRGSRDPPPQNGVLGLFTTLDRSLMEALQERVPAARFVKAFSCVGNALMVNPKLPGGPPTMFICGNDPAARAEVRAILDRFGWETEDLGSAEAARAIEPLSVLWCIPGFQGRGWMHALKMLRA